MAWKNTSLSDALIGRGAQVVYKVDGTDYHDAKHGLILFFENEFYCFKGEYTNAGQYFRLDCKYDGVNIKFHSNNTMPSNTKVKDKDGNMVNKTYSAAIKALIRDENHNVIKWYSTNTDRRKTLKTTSKYYANSISIMDKYMINIEIEKMLTNNVA
jgi:hypothetical protein